MIKLLIVEDDLYNQRAVEKIVSDNFPEIEIVGKAIGVKEAVKLIYQHSPELLILDIHLMDGTAFDLIRQTEANEYKIVFMSAFHEYALEALQFASVDFVYKPFDVNEMVIAVDKAIDELKDTSYNQKLEALFSNIDHDQKKRRLVLQGRTKIKVCHVNDIVWGKAITGGANFYFDDGSYFFATKPLRRYEAILERHGFFRCHPHYLVNLRRVKEIKEQLNRIRLSNDDEVLYEERRYHLMVEKLKQYSEFQQIYQH